MLDEDLASIYGVETRVLNQAVKRNSYRFPEDFMFQLTTDEFENLKSQNVISRWGGRRTLPYVFTEHGTVMLASVLKSPQAIQASIFVVRAFVKMREFFAVQQEFSKQLEELREKINDLEARHGEQFRQVFAALRQLIQTEDHPPQKRQPIGFKNNKN